MEALPSLGNRRSTGLGRKKLGTVGKEAGDSVEAGSCRA